MTTAIKQSLSNLNDALDRLDNSASEMQDNIKTKGKAAPADLFSVPQRSTNEVDAKAIASRLDGAIAKVEKLLREA